MDNTLNQNTYISLISSIITSAASKAKGVASISTESGIINKFTSKDGFDGMEIVITHSNMVVISLSINAYYGYPLPEIVSELQNAIKQDIEEQTNFKVKAINVNVVGVVFVWLKSHCNFKPIKLKN